MTVNKNTSNRKTSEKYDENGSLVADTRGMSTVEYLILLVVIGIASITLWNNMGKNVKKMATDSDTALSTVKSPD